MRPIKSLRLTAAVHATSSRGFFRSTTAVVAARVHAYGLTLARQPHALHQLCCTPSPQSEAATYSHANYPACKVLSSTPQHGRFKFNDGEYEGQTLGGQRHGCGAFVWNDGSRYEGQWVHDCMMGKGSWRNQDGQSYEGQWMNNKCHGRGTYNCGVAVYEGEFAEGERHGHGVVTFASSGQTLGQAPSTDEYTWSAGDQMHCCFQFGKRHGACTYTFFNGETFRCTWVNGRCPEFCARQRLVLASTDPKRAAVAKALQSMQFEVLRSRHCALLYLISPLTPPQHLLPSFEKEGVTDDTVRALALVDLKALGMSTMAQAVQFKTCVAEFLMAAERANNPLIEKPHAAASGAAAIQPSAPLLDEVAGQPQPHINQPHREHTSVPPEFTDQCVAHRALLAFSRSRRL